MIDDLVFEWTQTQGAEVFTKDLDQMIAKVRITDITEETPEKTLKFQLKVKNGPASDTAEVDVEVKTGVVDDGSAASNELYYPIVAFGLLGDGTELQTTLVIENVGANPEEPQIEFYDSLARIDHRFGNEGDFGRPERFSESFAIDPVQVE